MKQSRAPVLAWLLCGVVAASAIFQAAGSVLRPDPGGNALTLAGRVLWYLLPAVYAIVAALILSRQPRNLIAWLLMGPAIAMAIPAGADINRLTSAPAHPTLLLLLELWFDTWSWLLLIFPTLLIMLFFPTGRLLSSRWRWLIGLAGAAGAFLLFFATFAEQLAPNSEDAVVPWTVRNPIGFLPERAFPFLWWTVALGILTLGCIASLVVRFRRAGTVERAQMKWLLYACAAFAVFYVPNLILGGSGSILNALGNFLFPISLMTIPAAIAIAILRYRLWEIDVIIRRTLVYVPLTALLAGVFAASSKVLQTVLASPSGGQGQTSTVLTTLVVVAAFDPLKGWLQKIVDARFKETDKPQASWKAYGEQLLTFLQMNDAAASLKRLLEEAVAAFDVDGGEAYLVQGGELTRIHAVGALSKTGELAISLEYQGKLLGRLILGARANGRPYESQDRETLAQYAASVSTVLSLGEGRHPRA